MTRTPSHRRSSTSSSPDLRLFAAHQNMRSLMLTHSINQAYLDAGSEQSLTSEASIARANFTLPIGFNARYEIIVGVQVSDIYGAATTLNQ